MRIDGRELRNARTRLGMTQEALASEAGLNAQQINRYENERARHVEMATLRRLAEALQLPKSTLSPDIAAESDDRLATEPGVVDDSALIDRLSAAFVGRRFVDERLAALLDCPRGCGYLPILGDAGIGKTAIAAHLIKRNRAVYHFNKWQSTTNTASGFVRNVAGQMKRRFSLPDSLFESDSFDDVLLSRVLAATVDQLGGEKLLVVVDALDEVDPVHQKQHKPLLYLPPTLPPGVFVVLTSRNAMPPEIQDVETPLYIRQDSPEQQADVVEFLEDRVLQRDDVRRWLVAKSIKAPVFVERLVQQSECNFMYLRCVVDQLETMDADFFLSSLLMGLRQYYSSHWLRMGLKDDPPPYSRLKLIACIDYFNEQQAPLLVTQAAAMVGLHAVEIHRILKQWYPIIQRSGTRGCEHYSIYHQSFRDYLRTQSEVQHVRQEMLESVSATLFEGLDTP